MAIISDTIIENTNWNKFYEEYIKSNMLFIIIIVILGIILYYRYINKLKRERKIREMLNVPKRDIKPFPAPLSAFMKETKAEELAKPESPVLVKQPNIPVSSPLLRQSSIPSYEPPSPPLTDLIIPENIVLEQDKLNKIIDKDKYEEYIKIRRVAPIVKQIFYIVLTYLDIDKSQAELLQQINTYENVNSYFTLIINTRLFVSYPTTFLQNKQLYKKASIFFVHL